MARSLLAALICLLLASPAGAITVAPMDFVDLVQGSAAVIYARVKDVRGQWTANRQGIESLVTVDVLSAFKGAPGDTLTLTMPGGQVGRFVNVLPGAPSFSRRRSCRVVSHGPRAAAADHHGLHAGDLPRDARREERRDGGGAADRGARRRRGTHRPRGSAAATDGASRICLGRARRRETADDARPARPGC